MFWKGVAFLVGCLQCFERAWHFGGGGACSALEGCGIFGGV